MSDDIKARMAAIESRLAKSDERADAMEEALKANTAATLEGNRDTRELLELFQAVKGGFKVLGWLGTAARWITGMGAFAAACYAAWHSATGGSGKP